MFHKVLNVLRAQPRWRIAFAVLALIGAIVWFGRGTTSTADAAMFTARRGPLQISVLEGGTMQALDSQEIKCEVRVGYQGTKILKIVDEGYQITEDDVKNGKVLVELDSSELQKLLVQQEIQFQSAAAALADSEQGYDIQLNQNISDIMAAEQKKRFARMDFEKFLGSKVAEEVIQELGIDGLFASTRTNRAEPVLTNAVPAPAAPTIPRGGTAAHLNGADTGVVIPNDRALMLASLDVPPNVIAGFTNGVSAGASEQPAPEPRKPSSINFSKYASIDVLGDGEAKQKIRKFQDDLQVAQKEIGQAQVTLDGTRRLHEKQFVTRTDLQRDEIAFENARLKVQTAITARDLFLKYEFLKTSEETLSKYCEAVRELERARKAAVAKLAQAEAKLKSASAQYHLQLRQRKDLQDQIDKCNLRAQKPGLVVYGRAGDEMIYYGGEERVREGATVRERQTILTIPETTRMGVKVKIHETYIKKVHAGQKVKITVDAFADEVLDGEVTKVGVLPDSQNRWMNPDLKVYLTTISVAGTNDWLKPGMSAKVEILVDHLDDVVYVPIQSVVPELGEYACYVARGRSKSERREVDVGQFNDEFIEIKKGLAEGESVLLHPPKSIAHGSSEEETKPNHKSEQNGSAAAPRPAATAPPP